MLSTALVALDSTIIATAVLTIVDDLGGFAQFPWLFSIYLLAQAVTVPVYGKLADIFGRKPVMLWGIAIFALGSVLCGIATSMFALIVFRAIQGVGAGAVQPMALTIAGDIYSVPERAKAQGYIASVWAVSAVVGPALGGLFSEYLSWRWIFFVNIPLCALAALMLFRNFHERRERASRRVDVVGALLLTGGAGAVILGLLEGGHSWAWTSPTSYAIFGSGAVLLFLFAVAQRRVDEPMLPLWMFTRRVLAASCVVTFLIGAILLGLTSYIPTLVQGVVGTSAITAGFALAPLLIGWTAAASLSGRLYLRLGFRWTVLAGSVVATIGALQTVAFGPGTQTWQVATVCLLIGAGMGLVASPTLIAAQSSVEWAVRGVVTGTTVFARSIGAAVGVAVFGALVTAETGVVDHPPPTDLAAGLHLVFIAIAAAAGALILGSALLPGNSGGSRTR